MNTDILKRIMSEKKTSLPSLRNQDWKTVKAETAKINELSTHILMKNITKLNEVIYAGAKLIYEKIGVSLKNTSRNLTLGWEIRLEMLIRNLRHQSKIIRHREHAG